MRIVHVVSSIHKQASGPTHSVTALCRELYRGGHKVVLHTLSPAPETGFEFPVVSHDTWAYPRRLGVSRSMQSALLAEGTQADIIHSHGLWMMPNVYPERATRLGSAQLIVSPRGTLEPGALAFSRRKKGMAWALYQRRAVEKASVLHATAPSEARSFRDRGLRTPIAVIPNGVDLPSKSADMSEGRSERTVLALGRIHPKKRLELLIESFVSLEEHHLEWQLRIVGPVDNVRYAGRLRALAGEDGRIVFPGPAYGPARAAEYCRADLFVLPSRSENFGMVVAEALAHGLPALVAHGSPWSGLEDNRCGWWVPGEFHAFSNTLDHALSLPASNLREMGARGRRWMGQDFSWFSVARRMETLYGWVIGGGESPDFVTKDGDGIPING